VFELVDEDGFVGAGGDFVPVGDVLLGSEAEKDFTELSSSGETTSSEYLSKIPRLIFFHVYVLEKTFLLPYAVEIVVGFP
jgi:hypothetical protein